MDNKTAITVQALKSLIMGMETGSVRVLETKGSSEGNIAELTLLVQGAPPPATFIRPTN